MDHGCCYIHLFCCTIVLSLTLYREVKNNDALINEMTKDNQLKYDQLEQDKLLLHVMLLL
jgi:hypothetical protein